MKYLLDTHTLLWFFNGESKLSERVKALIVDHPGQICYSAISPFELSIKLSIGKLVLANPLLQFLRIAEENGVAMMSLAPSHFQAYLALPLPSRTPRPV